MPDSYHLQCTDCGSSYEPGPALYLCPACSDRNTPTDPPWGVLKAVYEYSRLRARRPTFELLCAGLARSPDPTWLLPLHTRESLPPLRVGGTPLYRIASLRGTSLRHRLALKDDSVNPTYSLKDRASAVVSAAAKEHGMETLVAASTGNAGSSIAGIAASQSQRAVVLVPARAPAAKLAQIALYGAAVVPVDGSYDQAFDLSLELSRRLGWYNRNTAFNPLTIEGKKTVSWEIARDLGEAPELVFVPCGDGAVLAGVYRGFEDLLELGLIARLPVLVAVQSEASDNLVRNLGNGPFTSKPSSTIADSISVDVPRNFRMARHCLASCNGWGITVSDREILDAAGLLARSAGLFAEPAAAAAFAGYLAASRAGRIADGSSVTVLLTGSGLKDIDAARQAARLVAEMPPPVEPTPEAVERCALAGLRR